MTSSDLAILADLPALSAWDFGWFPLGLEPLILPDPGVPDDPPWTMPGPETTRAYEEVCGLILHADRDPDIAFDLADSESANELYWFRWITGHQVSFVLWRLMAQVLDAVPDGVVPPTGAFESLTHYVRGYCAMLLYTSSCSRDVYQRLIRPSMYLQHRGFSGAWAPDYHPVRHLFRGRLSRWSRGPDAAGLRSAVELYELTHAGVAAKLVPGGRSLLQRAVMHGHHPRDRQVLGVLYDNFFMTLRGPVAQRDVHAQLLRRLAAIARDVAANGLNPSPMADMDERSDELRSRPVLDCEAEFDEINFRVAATSTGLAPDFVDERLSAPRGLVPVGDYSKAR